MTRAMRAGVKCAETVKFWSAYSYLTETQQIWYQRGLCKIETEATLTTVLLATI